MTIGICDIKGRSVSLINAGTFAAGSNNVVIYRENMLPGGCFLRLEANTQIGMKKIVIK